MGEDGATEEGYGQPDTSTPTTPDPVYDATTSAPDPTADAGTAGGLTEDLFNHLGSLYATGDYNTAIQEALKYIDVYGSDPNWGRLCYGLVMCYDMMELWPAAAKYMSQLYQKHGRASNDPGYLQQLQGYQANPPQHWTGGFLLY